MCDKGKTTNLPASIGETVRSESSGLLMGLFNYFKAPEEEARQFYLQSIQNNNRLSEAEKMIAILNSRREVQKYKNIKAICDQAEEQLKLEGERPKEVDKDWLEFFFDKAEKVSNESMQRIWTRLLNGELIKPGSISRKLMHIISIMDRADAESFKTFCGYVFEGVNPLASGGYDLLTAIIPKDFADNSLEFTQLATRWLKEEGFKDAYDLSFRVTMTLGQLNSIENLGLIHKTEKDIVPVDMLYHMEQKTLRISMDQAIPSAGYSLTSEGKNLYNLLGKMGSPEFFTVFKNYLKNNGIKMR